MIPETMLKGTQPPQKIEICQKVVIHIFFLVVFLIHLSTNMLFVVENETLKVQMNLCFIKTGLSNKSSYIQAIQVKVHPSMMYQFSFWKNHLIWTITLTQFVYQGTRHVSFLRGFLIQFKNSVG